jgi:hypothetical protein
MHPSFAFAKVIRHREFIDYWKIDSFINSQTFRCMKTKFPLCYYNQLVLILTQVDKYFLDIIYTDSDFFIATWDANLLLPVEENVIHGKFISRENDENLKHVNANSETNDTIKEIVPLSGENPAEKVNAFSLPNETRVGQMNAVILLGGTTWKVSIVLNGEIRLFASALRNWMTLQFILLPSKMSERFAVMEELILQYDMLTGLVRAGEEEENGRENMIEAVQMVTGTAAENTATIGIETTATSLGHAAAGVVLAVFVDIAVTASMLARAKVRKDRGKITEQQYKREIRDRLFQTGCQFVAGTTGTLVGQIVLPVPVVGAAIGGFVGSLVGLGVSMGVSKIHKVVERARKRKEMMMIEN